MVDGKLLWGLAMKRYCLTKSDKAEWIVTGIDYYRHNRKARMLLTHVCVPGYWEVTCKPWYEQLRNCPIDELDEVTLFTEKQTLISSDLYDIHPVLSNVCRWANRYGVVFCKEASDVITGMNFDEDVHWRMSKKDFEVGNAACYAGVIACRFHH